MQETPVDTTREILNRLIAARDARTGLLITKEGTAIAQAGDTSYLSTTAMAALVAGMFSATKEVARMVGELCVLYDNSLAGYLGKLAGVRLRLMRAERGEEHSSYEVKVNPQA